MHFMCIKFVFYFSSSEIFQHIKLLTVIGNVLHLEHWATYQQIYQHNFFGSVMLWFLVHRCKHVSRMNDSEKWITNRTHTSPKLCIFMLIFYCSLFSFQKLEMQIDGWLQSSRFHSILSDQIGFVHRIKAILFVRKMDKYRHELSRILWCWRNLCWIYSQIESQESITSELLHFMYTLAAPLFTRCCIKCFFRIQPKVIKSITI